MDTNTEEITEKKDRGFTLVELLIVIVILGILAAVTVFAVRGITDKSQENSCARRSAGNRDRHRGVLRRHWCRRRSLAALIPGYLRTDPSARWTFTAGSPPTIAGLGDCLTSLTPDLQI